MILTALKHLFKLILISLCLSGPVVAKALNITVTTNILADTVKNLVGDDVQVTTLMAAGVDPHLYRPTQGDIKRLLEADLIIYNGLHLEGRMQEIFEKLQHSKKIINFSDGIAKSELLYHEGHLPDPHIWMDPVIWHKGILNLIKEMGALFPDRVADLNRMGQIYQRQLSQLHERNLIKIAQIPDDQKLLITAHDAFAYFGRRYKIKVDALQGISTVSEFGLKDIQRLKQKIIKNRVKAIFLESTISPKFMQSLQQGLAAENHHINIGGKLFSDSLDLSGQPAGDYIGMITHNVDVIVKALQ